jgi:hypothetical protein
MIAGGLDLLGMKLMEVKAFLVKRKILGEMTESVSLLFSL